MPKVLLVFDSTKQRARSHWPPRNGGGCSHCYWKYFLDTLFVVCICFEIYEQTCTNYGALSGGREARSYSQCLNQQLPFHRKFQPSSVVILDKKHFGLWSLSAAEMATLSVPSRAGSVATDCLVQP